MSKIRDSMERNELLSKVSQDYVRGATQMELAEKYNVDVWTINKWLKNLRTKWLEIQVKSYDERLAVELNKIDATEAEYWNAWELSKKGLRKIIKSKINRSGPRGGVEDLDSDEFINQPGDPKYLEGVQRCISQRIKLFGLDAPTKLQLSGNVNHYVDTRGQLSEQQKIEGISRFLNSLEQRIDANIQPVQADDIQGDAIIDDTGEDRSLLPA